MDDPSDAAAGVHSVKLNSQRELEQLLRDGGLSRSAAVKVASVGWPVLGSGGPDEPDISSQLKNLSDLVRAATANLKKGS